MGSMKKRCRCMMWVLGTRSMGKNVGFRDMKICKMHSINDIKVNIY
jgi:hypothetical protein